MRVTLAQHLQLGYGGTMVVGTGVESDRLPIVVGLGKPSPATQEMDKEGASVDSREVIRTPTLAIPVHGLMKPLSSPHERAQETVAEAVSQAPRLLHEPADLVYMARGGLRRSVPRHLAGHRKAIAGCQRPTDQARRSGDPRDGRVSKHSTNVD